MRIAVLASSYPRFPGDIAGTFVRSTVEALAARGHELEVFAPRDPALRRPPRGRAPVHWYRYAVGDSMHVLGYARSLEGDQRLRRLAVLTMPGYLLSGVASVVRAHRRRPFDAIHGNWAVPGGVLAALISSVIRRPFGISIHGSDIFVASRQAYRPITGWALRRAGFVAACSPDLLEKALELGAPVERSSVVIYGVDAGKPWFPAEVALDRAPLISAVGRLVAKKGFDTLVRAVAILATEFPRARFAIGGGGPQEGELRRLAASLGVLDRFTFPGIIPHSAMAGFLSAADVLAVPSVVDGEGNMDGLPNVVLESLAAGRPVVASRLGGIPLALRDGVDGILVTPGSPEELAGAIAGLLRDPARRAALARAGRERAANDLSWDSVAANYERLFQGLH